MMPLQLIECPRDAMQGWPHFIPTEEKITYLNALLQAGFHTLDFGSYVSPKAIPQMRDTADVLKELDWRNSPTSLLAIVANRRGAEEAAAQEAIRYLGFPFSVSETFQQRNTNAGIQEALTRVEELMDICRSSGKTLVVYLSMGFGNPYGDPYSEALVQQWAQELADRGVSILSLADTVGVAQPPAIRSLTQKLITAFPDRTIGVHLHSTPANWQQKVAAAYEAGCRRFDGALKGIGGCPMAKDELVGNMNMEQMLVYLGSREPLPAIDKQALQKSLRLADQIFV